MTNFELVIFDCDGVLVDSEILANREAARVKTELGLPYTTEEHIEKFMGLGQNSTAVQEDLAKLPDTYWELMRVARTKAFEEELQEMPGVREVLKNLKAPFCIASSGNMEKIQTSMRVTGLGEFFPEQKIFNTQMVKQGKPAPDLFLLAAEKMGVSPKNCVVVEDSPSGIQGAKAADMKVIGFTGGQHVTENIKSRIEIERPDFLADNMEQLLAILNGND